jgi:hypothetical protein
MSQALPSALCGGVEDGSSKETSVDNKLVQKRRLEEYPSNCSSSSRRKCLCIQFGGNVVRETFVNVLSIVVMSFLRDQYD